MSRSDEHGYVKPMIFPSQLARRGRGEELLSDGPPEASADDEPKLTLRVVNTSLPEAAHEIVTFRKTSVTIGRSRSCDLRVDDRKQVVSGKHAELSIENGKLRVTDLGSRNFTYLDDRQLEPNAPCEVPPGSTVTIAEFAIQIESGGAESAPTEAPTVFEESYENPFREETKRLTDVLGRIAKLYEAEAPGRRDKALSEAVDEALGAKPATEIQQILERIVGSQ